ncbi:MAG: 16S rRNA (adenine(1518)-N(6)/adenine(1519)-N(6))-dimethyltransferase RsmA [bacterium]|nr:16S rRNA (adenine(1518)-N(6)/adenine(1519)-N(6))-dimethyltransferase RsmA [bacterium]
MDVKEILEYQGIKPSKELGQSFLVSEKIAERIVEACEIEPDDVILEVGPGLGILTQLLVKVSHKVFAVEKDLSLFKFLEQKFQGMKTLFLLNQDVLKLNPTHITAAKPLKLVSNLPYSITSDFLYWLLNNRKCIQSCILTLQREVAHRLMAQPGIRAYGTLSVFFQFWMDVEPIFSIPGKFFFPSSKIVSEVISLKPKMETQVVNEGLFLKIVKTSFAKRRKMLRNSLGLKINVIGGIDLTQRPESLSYEDFLQLAKALEDVGY